MVSLYFNRELKTRWLPTQLFWCRKDKAAIKLSIEIRILGFLIELIFGGHLNQIAAMLPRHHPHYKLIWIWIFVHTYCPKRTLDDQGQSKTGIMIVLLSAIENVYVCCPKQMKYLCYCPASRTTLVATRFRVAVICPIIQVPHCIRVFFYFVWFVFINHIFQFYYELCTYCNILDIYLS